MARRRVERASGRRAVQIAIIEDRDGLPVTVDPNPRMALLATRRAGEDEFVELGPWAVSLRADGSLLIYDEDGGVVAIREWTRL